MKNQEIRLIVISAFLAILTFCIYSHTLHYDFINFDDDIYVTDNQYVRDGLTLSGVKWAWTTFGNPYFQPITRISFLVESELNGPDNNQHHVTNTILHIINTLLVFYISWMLFRRTSPAFVVALFFSIHPQHVETVVWVSQRKELLSALFGFISLGFYIKYKLNSNTNISKKILTANSAYLLSLLFFLLSLLSKPTWMMLPFLLLLLDWWPLGIFKINRIFVNLIDKIPYLLLSGCFSLLQIYSLSSNVDHIINRASSLSILQRILNIPVIFNSYLVNTIIPVNLTGYHPYPVIPFPVWETLTATLTLLIITILVIRLRASAPYLLTGWLWFLISLFPVSGLIPAGESILTGDRWTYLPHYGLFLALSWLAVSSIKNNPTYKPYIITAVLFYIVSLVVINADISRHWENSGTYWKWSISTTVNNHYAYWKLGDYYDSNGMTDKAIPFYQRANAIEPNEPFYIIGLGNIYARKGDQERSWYFYNKLLKNEIISDDLMMKMGIVFVINRQYQYAVKFFNRIIKQGSGGRDLNSFVLSHLYLGHLHLMSGERVDAIKHFKNALSALPDKNSDKCAIVIPPLVEIMMITKFSESLNTVKTLCQKNKV